MRWSESRRITSLVALIHALTSLYARKPRSLISMGVDGSAIQNIKINEKQCRHFPYKLGWSTQARSRFPNTLEKEQREGHSLGNPTLSCLHSSTFVCIALDNEQHGHPWFLWSCAASSGICSVNWYHPSHRSVEWKTDAVRFKGFRLSIWDLQPIQIIWLLVIF